MTATCWICGAVLDAGGYEPLVRVVCRNCGQKICCNELSIICACGDAWCSGMGTVYKARDTQLERSLRSNCYTRILVAKQIKMFNCNKRHALLPV